MKSFIFKLIALINVLTFSVDGNELKNFDLQAYLNEFPFENYKIYKVEGLGKFYLDEPPDTIKDVLKSGTPWEAHLEDLMKKYITPGTVVVDAGAHIGTHCIFMSRLVGPTGKVVAFEPQRKIFRELFWNLHLNNITNVEIHHMALGAFPGIVHMNPTVFKNEGSTSIGSGGNPVIMRDLDSYNLSNVSLLKIDVEGGENALLRGAMKLISRCKPVILIELMGGYEYESAPDWVKQQIDLTRSLLQRLGYSVQKLWWHDYIALPH